VSVISELQRRNVTRVAALYGLAAWLIVQIADVLVPALSLPSWALRLVSLLLILGFPLVLIFAWVYELTPQGLKKQHEVDRGQALTHATRRRINYSIVALAAIAIAVLVVDRFLPRTRPNQPAMPAATTETSARAATVPPALEPKSIAVLPFVDMSPGGDQEYLADGISEELLNGLAKLPDLRVAARTSAFKFKGEKVSVQDAARQLNVAHVLEGSVRKSGSKVRITAQLIKAADGYRLWSETYDRTLDDIFAVQDDIARHVVTALEVTLLGSKPLASAKPKAPEAYNLVLQGRFLLDRRTGEAYESAIEHFRQALQRDPGFAPAWAGMSQAYAQQADDGYAPIADGYRRAREAAEKALALQPDLASGHVALAWIYLNYDWNWDAAGASYRRALALEPGNVDALRASSILAATLGRFDEALDLDRQALERDPLRPGTYANYGLDLLAIRREREAEAAFRKALELDPGGAYRHALIGQALLWQGKTDDALREIQQETDAFWKLYGLALVYHALHFSKVAAATLADLKREYGADSAFQIAEVHAYRGEADFAFEWLERAYTQRDSGVTNINSSRMFQALAGDPRYKAFLRKLKLPDEPYPSWISANGRPHGGHTGPRPTSAFAALTPAATDQEARASLQAPAAASFASRVNRCSAPRPLVSDTVARSNDWRAPGRFPASRCARPSSNRASPTSALCSGSRATVSATSTAARAYRSAVAVDPADNSIRAAARSVGGNTGPSRRSGNPRSVSSAAILARACSARPSARSSSARERSRSPSRTRLPVGSRFQCVSAARKSASLSAGLPSASNARPR
jgi:TolB-like protein/Tfp pilus assembly protein PilF